jgi:hypothetical protein
VGTFEVCLPRDLKSSNQKETVTTGVAKATIKMVLEIFNRKVENKDEKQFWIDTSHAKIGICSPQGKPKTQQRNESTKAKDWFTVVMGSYCTLAFM